MGDKGLIIFLLVFIVGACKIQSQVPTIVPRQVVTTATNQIQIWNGSAFVLKELVGFTSSSSQMTIPSAVDGSVTNEGQIVFSGNSTNGSVTVNTNTSGSTAIKIIGIGRTTVTKGNDTLYISTVPSNGFFQPFGSTTVNNGTLVTTQSIDVEDGNHLAFTAYIHYTTGATSQGIKFAVNAVNSSRGTYWYDYDFPVTGARQSGAIYNANTTITTTSSETGTNIAIIRGIFKSNNTGLFELDFQIAAEDGSSTVTVLNTSIAKTY